MRFKRLNQINLLLSKEEKKDGAKLFILIMAMGVFDVLGIASIMPFMSIASDPSFIESNQLMMETYNYLEFEDQKSFVMFFGLGVITLIITSTVIKLITVYAMYRFTFKREYTISLRLLTGYLNQPFSWFLNQHSSDLSKSVLADVREVVSRSILTTIMVGSNVFLAILIVSLLLLVDPTTALSAFLVFGFIYSVLYLSVKNTLDNIGIERLAANTARFKVSNETFSLIKEIKILGKEKFYVSVFGQATKKFIEKEILMQLISAFPKYFIEMVVFTVMIFIVLINLADDLAISTIIPIVALYAFAIYRLIPALQVIFANISLFKASASVLDFISEKYQQLSFLDTFEDNSNRLHFKNEITFKSMSFCYPETEKDALSQISIKIPAHNIIGIIGPTGSGKTTIVDVLLGLLSPYQGGLYIDGVKICEANVREWQRCIGYVPQHISLIDESISANIALGEHPDDVNMDLVTSAAKIANIHDFILSELEEGYETKVGDKGMRLSGGQRQRLGIARALYNKPDVLVLDEATSALDGETEQVVMDAVNNLGRQMTLVIIAHRLSTLAEADIVYKLEKGRLHSQGSYEVMCKTANA
jgi:ABC-type bacteriocin/lantibiotic exporter with double-glycine peptidase domain|tara:strand:- start:1139 stop:2908 length:1770 start_codon:yes stop_codon:yes gene_type:complete